LKHYKNKITLTDGDSFLHKRQKSGKKKQITQACTNKVGINIYDMPVVIQQSPHIEERAS